MELLTELFLCAEPAFAVSRLHWNFAFHWNDPQHNAAVERLPPIKSLTHSETYCVCALIIWLALHTYLHVFNSAPLYHYQQNIAFWTHYICKYPRIPSIAHGEIYFVQIGRFFFMSNTFYVMFLTFNYFVFNRDHDDRHLPYLIEMGPKESWNSHLDCGAASGAPGDTGR